MKQVFYKGKQVDLLREFRIGSEYYAEILIDGVEEKVVGNHQINSVPQSQEEKVVTTSENFNLDNEDDSKADNETPNKVPIYVEYGNGNNAEHLLFSNGLDSSDFQEFVSDNGLDMEAIHNILSGKQKTHKGFKFSTKPFL